MPVAMENFVRMYLLLDGPTRKRKHWVHPINSDRSLYGEYHHLFEDLRKDESRFFSYLRMKTATFDKLHSLLEGKITYLL